MHMQQGSMPVSSMHTGVLPRCTHCTLVHVLQGAHTYKCAPMQYMHQCTQCAVGQHTYTCLLQGYVYTCVLPSCMHQCVYCLAAHTPRHAAGQHTYVHAAQQHTCQCVHLSCPHPISTLLGVHHRHAAPLHTCTHMYYVHTPTALFSSTHTVCCPAAP